MTQDLTWARVRSPPPHAMLTRFSVRGFAKFIPFKPPPSGPCCGALSRLNFAFRGSGGVRRANLAAPHPAAEICEIYSVNSPHTKVCLVQNGRDDVRYGYVRTRHAQLELCGCGFHGNTGFVRNRKQWDLRGQRGKSCTVGLDGQRD